MIVHGKANLLFGGRNVSANLLSEQFRELQR
jgi:hypothetical protein